MQNILGSVDDLEFVNLTSEDVVRHKLVSRIVEAYESWDQKSDKGNNR